MVKSRMGNKQIGFATEAANEVEEIDDKKIMTKVKPKDLLGYGLIPEFIGRLPVIATLEELDRDDLVKVLTEPKNSLIKQYQQLFEYSCVQLNFAEQAIKAIAEQAIERKTGARGLRSIIEESMLETMFDVPSQDNIKEVVISEKVINEGEEPLIVYENDSEVENS